MHNNNLDAKKRISFILVIVNIIWIILFIRVAIIQILEGEMWKQRSEKQQYVSRSITANRGNIYDASGEIILAQSSTVETVTINPVNIAKENKEKVAKALSDIFELDYEKVYKKVNKISSIETIVKRVDKEKTDELRIWLEETGLYSGINIDEDTKRYYPYSTLASHIIGFVGSDNQGLDGIEAKYDEELKGRLFQAQSVLPKYENSKDEFKDISSSLEKALNIILKSIGPNLDYKGIALKLKAIECPKCGYINHTFLKENRSVFVRCPKCSHIFLWEGSLPISLKTDNRNWVSKLFNLKKK